MRELPAGFPVVSGGRRGASVQGMKPLRLTLLALAILAASAVAGIAAYATGVVDPGFTYGFSHDDAGRQTLVVASVRPGGLAWSLNRVSGVTRQEGFAAGTRSGRKSGLGLLRQGTRRTRRTSTACVT